MQYLLLPVRISFPLRTVPYRQRHSPAHECSQVTVRNFDDAAMPSSSHSVRPFRVLFAISFTAGSLGFASAYFPEYIKATFAAGLIFNMLQDEPRIDGMTKKGKKPAITGAVALKDVYFKYPERPDVPILQGLDINVRIRHQLHRTVSAYLRR